jgi:hypothetical protein
MKTILLATLALGAVNVLVTVLNGRDALANAENARANLADARENEEMAKANHRFAKELQAVTDEAVNGRLS